jgi:hypothetical protein
MLLQALNALFSEMDTNGGTVPRDIDTNKLTIKDRTYIIKSLTDSATAIQPQAPQPPQVVAFNGNKYILITRSKTMYIVVQAEGRRNQQLLNEALSWLARLCAVLINRDY